MQPFKNPRKKDGLQRLWQKIAKVVSIIVFLPMIEYKMVKLSMYPLMLGAIEAIVRGRKSNFSFLLGMCHDDVNRYGIFYYVVDG